MSSTRHFALSFFGPVITGGIFCLGVWLLGDWLERHHVSSMVTMLVGALAVGMITRRVVRTCVPVSCPFCGGKSYEIPHRGNRFMCEVCGKDH